MITDEELKKVVDELKKEFKDHSIEEFQNEPDSSVLALEMEAKAYIKKKKREML
jgi:hypothetical protein